MRHNRTKTPAVRSGMASTPSSRLIRERPGRRNYRALSGVNPPSQGPTQGGACRSREFSLTTPCGTRSPGPSSTVAASESRNCGEATGLPWSALDLTRGRVTIGQVATETAAAVTLRPYPKSRAGMRTIPLPDFLLRQLNAHRELTLVTPSLTLAGWSSRPATSRRSDARTSADRSGAQHWYGRGYWAASSHRPGGLPGQTTQRRQSIASFRPSGKHSRTSRIMPQVACEFHDLRHSYATWLVSDGVPVNIVQRVMATSRHPPRLTDAPTHRTTTTTAFSLLSGRPPTFRRLKGTNRT